MHKHLSSMSASSDGGQQQHFLRNSFGLANPRQQQQQAGGRGSTNRASGSSIPNSLYGFTPVSPSSPGSGDDAIAQAWEAVEQFYSSPNPPAAAAAAMQHQLRSSGGGVGGSSRHHQQHYPPVPAAAADAGYGYSSRSPQSRHIGQAQQQQQQHAAAAVQFAAGLSLSAGATGSRQQQYAAAGALPASSPPTSKHADAAGYGSSRSSSRDHGPQQQQGWGEQLGGVQGALGVQLMAGGGSVMAAMGGWVVNQAISAAADTAAAAFTHEQPATAAAPPKSSGDATQRDSPALPAAAEQVANGAGATSTSTPSSWWRRFSSRTSAEPQQATPDSDAATPTPTGSVAAAAGEGALKKASTSGIKSSIKAAAKRTGLRRKASVAAAHAATGSRGPYGSNAGDGGEADLGSGVGGSECSLSEEGCSSEGSAEYSLLLSQMDGELRDAAAAGAKAAVSGGGRGGAAAAAARRSVLQRGKVAGASTAAAAADGGAAAAVSGYDDISLAEEDDGSDGDLLGEDADGAWCIQQHGAGQAGGGGGWLAAVGLGGGGGSSSALVAAPPTAAAAAARGGSRRSVGGGGSYLWVEQRSGVAAAGASGGLTLADRAAALRGVLLWRSPGSSAKALGLGLYVIMLLGNIPRALHYMQVTTVLPGVALLYLAYNMAKPWAIRLYCSCFSSGSDARRLQARLSAAEEAAARAVVWAAARASVEAGSWSLALLALAHRALRARRFTTSCWTFVALWLLLLVSELRMVNQTLLAMLAYTGLFCVPWLYQQFRVAIDRVVYDVLHFMTLLVVNAERWAYALAVLAAALTWQLLEPAEASAWGASLVVRCTASGVSGLAVLLWRVLVSE